VSPSLALFSALAAVVVCGGLGVVTRKNPVHAAIFLVLTIFGIAGIYIMLEAEFLAAVQVLVYAGGILVLFLFVIMLVDLEERGRLPRGPLGMKAPRMAVVLALAGALLLVLGGVWATLPDTAPGASNALRADGGNLETVAMVMFRHFLLPFELASVLLLVAMIGAIVLAKPKV